MAMKIGRLAAAVSVTVAAAFSFLSAPGAAVSAVLAPHNTDEDMPDVPSSTRSGQLLSEDDRSATHTGNISHDDHHFATADEGFLHAAKFVDDHADLWELQSSSFDEDYVDQLLSIDRKSKRKPFAVEVLKLPVLYKDRVPVMRIVGFFPGISPSTLQQYVSDVRCRVGWDKNYAFFDKLGDCSFSRGDHSFTISSEGERSAVESLHSSPAIAKNSITRVLHSVGQVTDWSWCAHKVASPLLQKLGVKSRYFSYERAVVQPSPNSFMLCYRSVSHETSHAYPHALPSHHEALQQFIAKSFNGANDEAVFMHLQSILLLPVHDVQSELMTLLRTSRGLKGPLAPETIRVICGDSSREADAQKGRVTTHGGTMMVMTSINDARVPKSVPRWAEKRIAQFFTTQAYEMLYDAILNDFNL